MLNLFSHKLSERINILVSCHRCLLGQDKERNLSFQPLQSISFLFSGVTRLQEGREERNKNDLARSAKVPVTVLLQLLLLLLLYYFGCFTIKPSQLIRRQCSLNPWPYVRTYARTYPYINLYVETHVIFDAQQEHERSKKKKKKTRQEQQQQLEYVFVRRAEDRQTDIWAVFGCCTFVLNQLWHCRIV